MTPTPSLRAAPLLAVALAWLVTGCGADAEAPAASATTSTTPPTPAVSASASSEAAEPTVLSAEGKCHFKKAWASDIYVVETSPGLPRTAQALGGTWVWDHSADECVTSMEFVLRTAPPGSCMQVGLAKKNPDFDPDAQPADELDVVEEERGDC